MAETQNNGKGAAGTIAGILAGVVAAIVGGAKSCGREVREHPGRYLGPGIRQIYRANQDTIKRSIYPNGTGAKSWQYNSPYKFPATGNNSGKKEE